MNNLSISSEYQTRQGGTSQHFCIYSVKYKSLLFGRSLDYRIKNNNDKILYLLCKRAISYIMHNHAWNRTVISRRFECLVH